MPHLFLTLNSDELFAASAWAYCYLLTLSMLSPVRILPPVLSKTASSMAWTADAYVSCISSHDDTMVVIYFTKCLAFRDELLARLLDRLCLCITFLASWLCYRFRSCLRYAYFVSSLSNSTICLYEGCPSRILKISFDSLYDDYLFLVFVPSILCAWYPLRLSRRAEPEALYLGFAGPIRPKGSLSESILWTRKCPALLFALASTILK